MTLTTHMEMIERYPNMDRAVVSGIVRRAWVFVIYHYIERPIKRTARRIANSGYWSY